MRAWKENYTGQTAIQNCGLSHLELIANLMARYRVEMKKHDKKKTSRRTSSGVVAVNDILTPLDLVVLCLRNPLHSVPFEMLPSDGHRRQ